MVKSDDTSAARRGIGAAGKVAAIVRLLAAQPEGLRLTEIARGLALDAGLVHRYLASMLEAGLLEREPVAKRLLLGPVLLQARLAAAAQSTRQATAFEEALHAFHAQAGETIVLNRWTEAGPQAVWVEDSPDSVSLTVRLGSVLPLLSTATGHVALAFAPAEQVRPLVAAELAAQRRETGTPRLNRFDVQDLQRAVARRGLARGKNFLYGIAALAAPLFDPQRRFWGTLTVLGPKTRFAYGWRGEMAQRLHAFRQAHGVPVAFSRQLPARPAMPFKGEKPARALKAPARATPW